MPLYDFECESCGAVVEHYAGVDERSMRCSCGANSRRLITTRYSVIGDVEFVTDNITGDPVRITSRRQLHRMLKENGLSETYGKGWR